ncbi:hypothetical protein C8Q77DRAFT_543039 [Trametes polyzona]|nr:hypothetical protein C8Q77DRAFT_543039 [Trametes polyzona]
MSISGRPSFGLPSTPRARSFNASGQYRQDIPSRPPSAASERRPPPSSYNAPPLPVQPRVIRPQRSYTALPSAPSGSVRSRSLDRRAEPRHAPSRSDPPPPLPGLPTPQRIGRPPAPVRPERSKDRMHAATLSVDNHRYRRSEDVMSDSASSSGGSGTLSPLSAASSRTSIDDEEHERKDTKTPAGHGSSLWSNITSVASNLTISVSKAWSSNIATYSGEETPVGGESRLTRAMKAYHIDKARNPADLPEWLFDERERGVRGHQVAAKPAPADSSPAQTSPAALSRSATTARRPEAPPAPTPVRIARGPTLADRRANAGSEASAGSEEHVTKSMARLRALRDAKRSAKVRFHGGEDDDDDDGQERRGAPQASAPIPPPPSMPANVPVSRQPPPTTPTRPRGPMPAPLGAGTPLGLRGRQPTTRVGLPTGVRPVRV